MYRGGRWSNRPNLKQIEQQAAQLVSDFRQALAGAGLAVPQIPPIPVEYLALTLTELSLRGEQDLSHNGQALAGLLDTAHAEILYEASDMPTRRNFTIAHELGHYFLHYLPTLQIAEQPTLFDPPPAEMPLPARFFRCDQTEPMVEVVATQPLTPLQALKDPAAQVKLARVLRQHELQNRLEWEANTFASSLLLPSELVREVYQKYASDIPTAAAELAVSQTALRIRLQQLGLIPAILKGNNPTQVVESKQPSLF